MPIITRETGVSVRRVLSLGFGFEMSSECGRGACVMYIDHGGFNCQPDKQQCGRNQAIAGSRDPAVLSG